MDRGQFVSLAEAQQRDQGNLDLELMFERENPCRAFFDAHEKNPKKVELLCREADRAAWEKLSASRHPPGPVGDDEELARVVISPIHIDEESGEVTLASLRDVKDTGARRTASALYMTCFTSARNACAC